MTTATLAPPTFNPLLPAYREDPHPFLRRLREEDPVHWSPVFQVWVLTRYADCLSALRDPRLSASSVGWENYAKFFRRPGQSAPPPSEVYRHWMLQLDAPDHTRIRGLVNKAFTPRVVEQMRPRVRSIVDELLDAVERNGGACDAVADIGYPIPIRVIADMLGIPPEDQPQVKAWSSALLPSFGPIMSADQLRQTSVAMSEFSAFYGRMVAARRRDPKDDLLSLLIAARDAGGKLTDPELVATCILLVFAGHMTTVQLIAGGILELARHPDQWARLRAQPALIPSAVEEMLRYLSPLQVVGRIATTDFELAGKTIRNQQMVLFSFPAANRDPAQFADPDAFDVGRTDNRHVAFGYGSHFCLGASLAGLEAQVVFESLVARFDSIELTSQRIDRDPTMLLRGLKSLPVRLGRKPSGGTR